MEIRRNRATIALAKFLSALSRVRTGLSGLPGCRASDRVGAKSGRRWSANAHFLKYFFQFLALTVRIPLFKRTGHTQKSGLIFRLLEGLSGLPCSGSGGCEKRPFMIHEGAFFGYFFIFLAPTVRLPLFKRSVTHTHTQIWTHLYIYRWIFIIISFLLLKSVSECVVAVFEALSNKKTSTSQFHHQ